MKRRLLLTVIKTLLSANLFNLQHRRPARFPSHASPTAGQEIWNSISATRLPLNRFQSQLTCKRPNRLIALSSLLIRSTAPTKNIQLRSHKMENRLRRSALDWRNPKSQLQGLSTNLNRNTPPRFAFIASAEKATCSIRFQKSSRSKPFNEDRH